MFSCPLLLRCFCKCCVNVWNSLKQNSHSGLGLWKCKFFLHFVFIYLFISHVCTFFWIALVWCSWPGDQSYRLLKSWPWFSCQPPSSAAPWESAALQRFASLVPLVWPSAGSRFKCSQRCGTLPAKQLNYSAAVFYSSIPAVLYSVSARPAARPGALSSPPAL